MKKFQPRKIKLFWRKGIACLLVCLQTSLLVYTSAAPVYAETPVNVNQLSRDRTEVLSPVSIPAELGTVEEFYSVKPQALSDKNDPNAYRLSINTRPTIIYIQDAHDSLEAQKNIAKIIHYLVEHEEVKTVFEEGYEGEVPTDQFFGIIHNEKLRRKISYFLLDRLRLGGAEYAHINRKQNFKLIGADSEKWHDENIRWYRKVAAGREAFERDIRRIEEELKNLAYERFPAEVKEILKLKKRFDQKEVDLLDYLQRLTGLIQEEPALDDFPNIKCLLSLKNTSPDEMNITAKTIDPAALYQELYRFPEYAAGRFLNDKEDIEIFSYLQSLELVRQLSLLKVTTPEFNSVKKMLEKLETRKIARFIYKHTNTPLILSAQWEQNVRDAVRFYEIAGERDRMVERELKEFSVRGKEKTAVLVYGGFHKEGITELLKRENFSYVVITPHISESSPKHQRFYEQLMSQGALDFESVPDAARAVIPKHVFRLMDRNTEFLKYLSENLSPQLARELMDAEKSELRVFPAQNQLPAEIQSTPGFLEAAPKVRKVIEAMDKFREMHQTPFPEKSRYGAGAASSLAMLEEYIEKHHLRPSFWKRHAPTIVYTAAVLTALVSALAFIAAGVSGVLSFLTAVMFGVLILLELPKLLKRPMILDAGTGDGQTAFILAAYTGYPVVSIEADKDRLDFAKNFESFLEEEYGLQYKNLKIEQGNFLDQPLDAFSSVFFHWMTGREDDDFEYAKKIVRKLNRDLKDKTLFYSPLFFVHGQRNEELGGYLVTNAPNLIDLSANDYELNAASKTPAAWLKMHIPDTDIVLKLSQQHLDEIFPHHELVDYQEVPDQEMIFYAKYAGNALENRIRSYHVKSLDILLQLFSTGTAFMFGPGLLAFFLSVMNVFIPSYRRQSYYFLQTARYFNFMIDYPHIRESKKNRIKREFAHYFFSYLVSSRNDLHNPSLAGLLFLSAYSPEIKKALESLKDRLKGRVDPELLAMLSIRSPVHLRDELEEYVLKELNEQNGRAELRSGPAVVTKDEMDRIFREAGPRSFFAASKQAVNSGYELVNGPVTESTFDNTVKPVRVRDSHYQPGSLVYIRNAERLIVVGDLHSRYDFLSRILKEVEIEKTLRENPNTHLIILGDALHPVSRMFVGPADGEIARNVYADSFLLFLQIQRLKQFFPSQVHYIPGNHDYAHLREMMYTRDIRPVTRRDDDDQVVDQAALLESVIEERFPAGTRKGFEETIYNLPVVLHVSSDKNKMVFSHAGIAPSLENIQQVIDARLLMNNDLLNELLWNRNYAPEGIRSFLDIMDAQLAFGGHTFVEDSRAREFGFKVLPRELRPERDAGYVSNLIILDSTKYPHYADIQLPIADFNTDARPVLNKPRMFNIRGWDGVWAFRRAELRTDEITSGDNTPQTLLTDTQDEKLAVLADAIGVFQHEVLGALKTLHSWIELVRDTAGKDSELKRLMGEAFEMSRTIIREIDTFGNAARSLRNKYREYAEQDGEQKISAQEILELRDQFSKALTEFLPGLVSFEQSDWFQQSSSYLQGKQLKNITSGVVALRFSISRLRFFERYLQNGHPHGKAENIAISDVLDVVIDYHQSISGKLAFEFLGPENIVPSVHMDPDFLADVFDNLFRNAAQHEAANIKITVTSENTNGWMIRVEDDGSGIRPDMLEMLDGKQKLFHKGESGRNSTGIGLYLVDEILKDSGGRVEAANLSGTQGAVFTIYLPAQFSVSETLPLPALLTSTNQENETGQTPAADTPSTPLRSGRSELRLSTNVFSAPLRSGRSELRLSTNVSSTPLRSGRSELRLSTNVSSTPLRSGRSELRAEIEAAPGLPYSEYNRWTKALRDEFNLKRREIWDSGRGLKRKTESYTALGDEFIMRIVQKATELYGADQTGKIAFIAAGSFGRVELTEGSDLDGLMLLRQVYEQSREEMIQADKTGVEKRVKDDDAVEVRRFISRAIEDIIKTRAPTVWGTAPLQERWENYDTDETLKSVSELLDMRFVGGNRQLYEAQITAFKRQLAGGKALRDFAWSEVRAAFSAWIHRRTDVKSSFAVFWEKLSFWGRTLFVRENKGRDKLIRGLINMWNIKFVQKDSIDGLYHLEQNIKEDAGGLRSLHFSRWVAQVYSGNWQNPFETLIEQGVISAAEYRRASRAAYFLNALRQKLFESKQDPNTLSIPVMTDEFARSMGYRGVAEIGLSPTEEFLRKYQKEVRNIFIFTTKVLRRIGREIDPVVYRPSKYPDPVEGVRVVKRKGLTFRLRGGFQKVRNQTVLAPGLDQAGDKVKMIAPGDIMPLFKFSAEHSIPINGDLRDVLAQSLPGFSAAMRLHEINAQVHQEFWDMLKSGHRVAYVIERMHYYGYLEVIFPGFSRIVALTRLDIQNPYSADIHALKSIEFLDRLAFDTSKNAGEDIRRLQKSAKSSIEWLGKGDHGLYGVLRLAFLLKPFYDLYPEKIDEVLESFGITQKGVYDDEYDRILFLLQHSNDLIEAIRYGGISDAGSFLGVFHASLKHKFKRWPLLILWTLTDINLRSPARLWLYENELAYASEVMEHTFKAPHELLDRLWQIDLKRFDRYYREIESYRPNGLTSDVRAQVLKPKEGQALEVAQLQILQRQDDAPGRLAKIAGILFANGLEVSTAKIRTAGQTGVLFDEFFVRKRDILHDIAGLDVLTGKAIIPKDAEKQQQDEWRRIEKRVFEDMASLFDGIPVPGDQVLPGTVFTMEDILKRRGRSLDFKNDRLGKPKLAFDNRIKIRPAESEKSPQFKSVNKDFTWISVEIRDFPGALYVVAQALANMGINILPASRIDTEGYSAEIGEKALQFWAVTFDGHALDGPMSRYVEDVLTKLLEQKKISVNHLDAIKPYEAKSELRRFTEAERGEVSSGASDVQLATENPRQWNIRGFLDHLKGRYAVVVDMQVFEVLSPKQQREFFSLFEATAGENKVRFIFNTTLERYHARDPLIADLKRLAGEYRNIEVKVDAAPSNIGLGTRHVINISKEGFDTAFTRLIDSQLRPSKKLLRVRYLQNDPETLLITAALLLLETQRAELRFLQMGEFFSEVPGTIAESISSFVRAYIYMGSSA